MVDLIKKNADQLNWQSYSYSYSHYNHAVELIISH